MSPAPPSFSGSQQARLWGQRAADWADFQEATMRPLYEAALKHLGVATGMRLLDVGCGSGLFCRLAAERGVSVCGLDATEPLIAIATRRVPAARFWVGDLEALPFEDGAFDVVTGFNAFQYAAHPSAALAEARRVTRRSATVLIATWGRAEDCEAVEYIKVVNSFLPPPPPGTPGPFALSDEAALRAMAAGAGLAPLEVRDVDVPFAYPDLDSAIRGVLSAGPAVRAIEAAGEAALRVAMTDVLARFRESSGGYRMDNRFRYLISRA